MKDSSLPVLNILNEGNAINIIIPVTQAQSENQGYSYNQASLTYNQAGVFYAGLYSQNEDIIPILLNGNIEVPFIKISPETLDLILTNTNASLYDQGNTYNQAGLTYDQAGIAYAGLYNQNQDVLPLTLTFNDIYISKTVPPKNSGYLIGILGLTYP